MPNGAEVRRGFGLFFLVMAAGLLILGQTALHPLLHGVGFIIYWLVCFIFTASTMLMALLDVRAVRRQSRNQQRELIEHTLREAIPKRDEKAREPEQ